MKATLKKAIIIFFIGLFPVVLHISSIIPNIPKENKQEVNLQEIIDDFTYEDIYNYCGLFLQDISQLINKYPDKYNFLQEYVDYYNKGELLELVNTLNSDNEKKLTVNMFLNDIFSMLDEKNITPEEVYKDWDERQ